MNTLIKETRSFCPECFEEIEAKIFEAGGRAIMHKTCNEHGLFKGVVENDVDFYKMLLTRKTKKIVRDKLVIPITHKCNLACKFCYLPYDDIQDFSDEKIQLYIKDPRYRDIIFSGGEPTLHPSLIELIKLTKSLNKKTCIVTNGEKLANWSYVQELKAAGLDRVNFSLDASKDIHFEELCGKKMLSSKLKALKNLKEAGINTILSFSCLRDFSGDDFKKIFKLALKNNSYISQLRCRAYAHIGRFEETEQTTMSDFIHLFSGLTGFSKDEYTEHWFQKRDIIKPYLFKINYFEFITQRNAAKKIKSHALRYLGYPVYIWRHLGFFNLVRLILGKLTKRRTRGLEIMLFCWPDKHVVDLDEIDLLLNHVALDGSINPFFYSLLINEKIHKDLTEDLMNHPY
jgi:uncharacterized radical SAM superfamily Fe-S cluster-containing enzyme